MSLGCELLKWAAPPARSGRANKKCAAQVSHRSGAPRRPLNLIALVRCRPWRGWAGAGAGARACLRPASARNRFEGTHLTTAINFDLSTRAGGRHAAPGPSRAPLADARVAQRAPDALAAGRTPNQAPAAPWPLGRPQQTPDPIVVY